MNTLAATTAHTPVTYACQLVNISPLNGDTCLLELQTPKGTAPRYYAGQYLQLGLDINNDGGQQWLSYSIANCLNPQQPGRLQLFIQNSSAFAAKVFKHLHQLKQHKAPVHVRLPMGKAFLQTNLSLPHILVAAGSGISKIKCLSEAILKQQANAHVHVYWSNKTMAGFYLLDYFKNLAQQYKNFHFTPIVEAADARWPGRSGYIYTVIKQDVDTLNNTQLYLCGSPTMVYGTIDQLTPCGLKQQHCYSDVFDYAPRQQIAI